MKSIKPQKTLPTLHTTKVRYRQLTKQNKGLEIQYSQRMHLRNFIRSKSILCKVLLLLNFIAGFAYFIQYRYAQESYFKVLDYELSSNMLQALKVVGCNFPKLEPFNGEILQFFSKADPINCINAANGIGEQVFVQERGSRVLVRKVEMDSQCCYRPFQRVDDGRSEAENLCVKITEKRTTIPLEYEFVEVICVGGSEDYRDGFAFVDKKTEVEELLQGIEDQYDGRETGKDRTKLSVIVLGFDATSRMSFIRNMPKSNKYLLKNLSAISINGYTKVGENTLPNVVPILTGQKLEDFKENCVNDRLLAKEVHLDNCPFIWKRFKSQGYRTGFAEDDATIGIFNMNWGQAFEKPPTDYYLRPFSNRMQQSHSFKDGQCYGTRLSFQVLLDNLENTATAFNDSLYFHFTWSTKLSHSDPNQLQLGDGPLLRFLKFMKKSDLLENTALLIMSDHGNRINEMRATQQGKIEDRMPLLYVVLPHWFPKRYAAAYKNILANSERLTSAFDIHKTLLDFIDLNRLDELGDIPDLDQSGQSPRSLFDHIPINRSCHEAGISLHWCVCIGSVEDQQDLNVNHMDVKAAVEYSLASINYRLKGQSSCAYLNLGKITDGFFIHHHEKEKEPNLLRVSFTTFPGEGAWEATLIKNGRHWKLTDKVIRTNEYGDQSRCVVQEYKDICYCTDNE